MNNLETIQCPYCAETVQKAAKKCKHCGEIIDPQMREIEYLKAQRREGILINNNVVSSTNGDKISFGHLKHFILTLLTGGMWVFIWAILYFTRDRNRYH